MICVRIAQLFCLVELVSSQAFLWLKNDAKKGGGDYTGFDKEMFEDYFGGKDDENGVDVLSKGGIPEKVAIEAIDSLNAYKDFNTKLLSIKDSKYGKDYKMNKIIKKEKITKMRYKVRKNCKTTDACMKIKNCIGCGPQWCIKLKHHGAKLTDHCKRILERSEKKCCKAKKKQKTEYCKEIVHPRKGC